MRVHPTLRNAGPALLVSCLLVSCENYRFVAKSAEEFRVPASELAQLVCTTHNGKIEIEGTEGVDEVVVQAFLSARGPTPEEAEQNLQMLRVTREVRAGRLELDLEHPDPWWGVSPSVAFIIQAPPHLSGRLLTHNGAIVVNGMRGELIGETHNGNVVVVGDFDQLRLTTHNGSIRAEVVGEGPVDGKLETHNGSVTVALDDTRSTRIVANTHNGAVRATREMQSVEKGRNWLVAESGTGEGRLEVETHNGSVTVR